MLAGVRYLWPLAIIAAFSASFPGRASQSIGVVFLHGKQSAPEQMAPLVTAMRAAGHSVDVPEMCWSHRRIYDRTLPDCLREIDEAVRRLRASGARAIVVAGHSQGANGALAYAVRRDGLAGVIMLAPGHRPERLVPRRDVTSSLASARAMLAQGKGDVRGQFVDLNGGLTFQVTTTPRIYLSFFAEDSAAIMPANAPKLRVPLLYVVGSGDPLQRGPEEIFARVPSHRLNRYVTVEASHFDTLIAARDTVMTWLRDLAQP